jgi:hypothetical protein
MNCKKLERTLETIERDRLTCALRYRVIVREMAALRVEKAEKIKRDKQFETLLRSGK